MALTSAPLPASRVPEGRRLLCGLAVAFAVLIPACAHEGPGAEIKALGEAAERLEKDGDTKGAKAVYHQALDLGIDALEGHDEPFAKVKDLRTRAEDKWSAGEHEASLQLYSEAIEIAAKETESEGGLTDVNFATVMWAWVSFGVTFLALRKIAWPMLQAKMEEREVRIAEGLKKAEEAEKRAQELLEKQEQILNEARQEAQKLLADSRSAGENVKNDLLAAAQKEIAAERDRAKKEIGLERAKAVEDLKQATVELTLDAAARILKREMKGEDHRRLAREVIDEVAAKR